MNRSKRLLPALLCAFALGLLITVSEPCLTVLAEQIPSVPNMVLILSVAVGVGLFLAVSMLRTLKGWALNYLLIGFYILVGVVAPSKDAPNIMNAVNKKFGLRQEAQAFVHAMPVEHAMKI